MYEINPQDLADFLDALGKLVAAIRTGETGTGAVAPAAAPPVPVGVQPTPPTTAPAYQPPMPAGVPQGALIPTAAPAAPPTAQAQYTIDDLRKACGALIDANAAMQPQIMQLFNTFGVQSIHQLDPAKYGEFAAQLRQMGGVL